MTNKVLNLRVTPSSTLVEFLEYDQQKQEMLVKFKRGKYKGMERLYFEIPNTAFMHVLDSESVGKSLLELIKNKKGIRKKRTILGRLFATL